MSRKLNHCSKKGCDRGRKSGLFLLVYLQQTSGIFRSNEIGRTKKVGDYNIPYSHSFNALLKAPKH